MLKGVNIMERKYSISDLVTILGITRTAVDNKVRKYGFNTVKGYVDGRAKTLVMLNNAQLEALKNEVKKTRVLTL